MNDGPKVHSKLLTEAANRTHTWLDDRGWWLGVVEFQPSDWSRGSYLNVGCTWLWQVKAHIAYDEGGRVASLVPFVDENQFRAVADSLAQQGAREIMRYWELFPSALSACNYYLRRDPVGFWPTFNAAIACAVAGRTESALGFFRRIDQWKGDNEWVADAQPAGSRHRWLSTVGGREGPANT